jgi:methylthioribose-1-phosphate isomerase
VRNPAFDVTPAELITGIICEKGIAFSPYGESIAALLK